MDTLHGVNTLQLPPSAQAVLQLLDDGKPRTFKEMTKQADIAPRTIRYAIKRLKDNDLIIEKFNFRDARQVIYQKKEFVITEDDLSATVIVS
jgi:predicted transcriptional regulator